MYLNILSFRNMLSVKCWLMLVQNSELCQILPEEGLY